jgi:hypothetical protein
MSRKLQRHGREPINTMKSVGEAKLRLGGVLLAALVAWALTVSGCGSTFGCNGFTGSSNSPFTGCSGGQNIPAQSAITFVGRNGTVFKATVSDRLASYSFQATVPLQVIYVNNSPPVRVLATLLSPAPAFLSAEAFTGYTLQQLASTSSQGTTISLAISGTLNQVAGPPPCDVRFNVQGPVIQSYESLLEQNNNAYENTTAGPTLYLLGGASGDIFGTFTETVALYGPIKVNLAINGNVKTGAGSTFTLKGSCP